MKAVAVWAVVLGWAGYVTFRAHAELTERVSVDGPTREWRAPYEELGRWVLDPRPGSLEAELRDRYCPGWRAQRLHPQGETWSEPSSTNGGGALPTLEETPERSLQRAEAALSGLCLTFERARGLGEGLRPRIVVGSSERPPMLIVGWYGRDPVVFDPARGIVRLRAGMLPDDAPTLVLTNAREPPP